MTTVEFRRRPSALAYMLGGALLGSRRRGPTPLALSARWRGCRVEPAELRSFLAIIGGAPSGELPLLYPHTIGFRLAMAVLTQRSFPVPIWGVLQTRNHITRHRPIAADATLDFETRVAAQRCVEKGAEFDLHTAVRVVGALAWESLLTFYTRERLGAPEAPSPLALAPPPPAATAVAWTMAAGSHWAFGRLTGDYNGIHMADWYARRFGFPRALYHPSRVLAACLARVPGADATPLHLDVWLKGPIHHGATVRMTLAEGEGETRFALFAGGDRAVIVGRLQRG